MLHILKCQYGTHQFWHTFQYHYNFGAPKVWGMVIILWCNCSSTVCQRYKFIHSYWEIGKWMETLITFFIKPCPHLFIICLFNVHYWNLLFLCLTWNRWQKWIMMFNIRAPWENCHIICVSLLINPLSVYITESLQVSRFLFLQLPWC